MLFLAVPHKTSETVVPHCTAGEFQKQPNRCGVHEGGMLMMLLFLYTKPIILWVSLHSLHISKLMSYPSLLGPCHTQTYDC